MLDLSPHRILVRAEWDADAAVWTALSTDVPGLVAEAGTLEALQAKLPWMISDLIELNRPFALAGLQKPMTSS